jgi:hypothetical protein
VFCNSCNADIPNTSRFCPMCGDSFLVSPNLRSSTKVGSWTLLRFAAAGILLLLSALGYFAYSSRYRHSANYALRAFDQLTKKPRSVPVSDHALTINQLGYSYVKIEVPQRASSVAIQGNFTASGGGGNTIEVFVFSESGYENWQKQQYADPFYSSGRVSMDTIQANLPSGKGTYYLVLNNKFSTLTPKTIRMDAKVTYYQ